MGENLLIYAWDTSTNRYLHSSEFKVTVDLEEGLHVGRYIAFLDLPVDIHYVRLLEKPDGYILDKWESGAGAVWVEVDVHYPERARVCTLIILPSSQPFTVAP